MPKPVDETWVCAKWLAFKLYGESGETAVLNIADLMAAVEAVDDWMNTNVNQFQGPIKRGFVASLPDPFASKTTRKQKLLLLAAWAIHGDL